MSVLDPPRHARNPSGQSLPPYSATGATGATYPPALVATDAKVSLSRPSKLRWLSNVVAFAALIGTEVVLISCVAPSTATVIAVLGTHEDGIDGWQPFITFWSNSIPIDNGFVRDQIAPPQGAFVALGILHILAVILAFALLICFAFRHADHAWCLPAHRLHQVARRIMYGIYWTLLAVISGAWLADFSLARQAEAASATIVDIVLQGGSVVYAMPWAFLLTVIVGIILAYERRRELQTNAMDALKLQKRRTKIADSRHSGAADIENGNAHVGAPTAEQVIGRAPAQGLSAVSTERPSSADAQTLGSARAWFADAKS